MESVQHADNIPGICCPPLVFFPQQQNFAMGSLAQISPGAASTPGSGQSSGGFWCRYLVRFRRGSGADTSWGSGGFRWRLLVRFRRVPLKIPAEAPEGSVRFRKFPVQEPGEVPEVSGAATWWRRVPGQIPCEAPEGSGAETLWGSGRFWQRRCLVRFRRVPVQIPCEVPESSGADALWNSKGFRFFLRHKNLYFMARRLIFMP